GNQGSDQCFFVHCISSFFMNGIHERLMRAEQGVRGIVSLLQFTNIFTKVYKTYIPLFYQ
nr:hypothetical protein [Enterocloster sp.]